MSEVSEVPIEKKITQWILQSKPTADVEKICSGDLIESRLLDSMQFLDFVYFLNEICGKDIAKDITLEHMRTLPSIVSFVESQRRVL